MCFVVIVKLRNLIAFYCIEIVSRLGWSFVVLDWLWLFLECDFCILLTIFSRSFTWYLLASLTMFLVQSYLYCAENISFGKAMCLPNLWCTGMKILKLCFRVSVAIISRGSWNCDRSTQSGTVSWISQPNQIYQFGNSRAAWVPRKNVKTI